MSHKRRQSFIPPVLPVFASTLLVLERHNLPTARISRPPRPLRPSPEPLPTSTLPHTPWSHMRKLPTCKSYRPVGCSARLVYPNRPSLHEPSFLLPAPTTRPSLISTHQWHCKLDLICIHPPLALTYGHAPLRIFVYISKPCACVATVR
jgi:hypothetical protein